MIQILIKEQAYEVVIINFGAVFGGIIESMSCCDEFFLLIPKGQTDGWREKDFLWEIQRKAQHDFIHRIKRVELPPLIGNQMDWRKVMEQWRWGVVGSDMEELIWMKNYAR